MISVIHHQRNPAQGGLSLERVFASVRAHLDRAGQPLRPRLAEWVEAATRPLYRAFNVLDLTVGTIDAWLKKKLPGLARSVGEAAQEFRKALRHPDDADDPPSNSG